MKFTNKVKIIIYFGEKYSSKVTFYGNGNTEVRGDKKQFTITGEFAHQEKEDGKDASGNID